MTIRENLRSKKRDVKRLIYGEIALSLLFLVPGALDWVKAIGIFGFALMLLTALFAMYWLVCPKCKGKLSGLLLESDGLFSATDMTDKIQVCPYCRAEFDGASS
jgi:hypothetical protein